MSVAAKSMAERRVHVDSGFYVGDQRIWDRSGAVWSDGKNFIKNNAKSQCSPNRVFPL